MSNYALSHTNHRIHNLALSNYVLFSPSLVKIKQSDIADLRLCLKR